MGSLVYRFGEFELDSSAFELRRRGEAVSVQPQVFAVIEHLVRNANRLVSRDELLQAVWGDSFVSEATLSSRIMAARKALGDTGRGQQWIRTVHGRGVRFVGRVEATEEETAQSWTLDRLLEEARGALGRADTSRAEEWLVRAEAALQANEEADAMRAEWHSLRAQWLILRRGWGCEEAREHYEEAIRIAEGVAAVDQFRSARYHLATMHELRADFSRSETLMRAAVAQDLEGRDAESRELLACSLFHQGRFDEAAEQARRGAETCGDMGSNRLSAYYGEDPQVSCNYWLALALWISGDEDEAARHESRALRLSEQPGRIFCLAHSRQQSAMLAQLRRDFRLCEHWASATVAIGERQGLAYREAAGRILLGWARAMLGEATEFVEPMAESLGRLSSACAEMEAPYFGSLLAEVEMKAGRASDAAKRLRGALESSAVSRGYFFHAEMLRLLALADFEATRAKEVAARLLGEAKAVAERQGARAFATRIAETLTSTLPG